MTISIRPAEIIFILLTSAWYFRLIATSDRILSAVRPLQPPSRTEHERLIALGLVSFKNLRVIVNTIVFMFALVIALLVDASAAKSVLLVLAIGVFAAPLAIPSVYSPGAGEVLPGKFTLKWLLGTTEVWLKVLLISGVCELLSHVSFMQNAGSFVMKTFLPIIEDEPATKYIQSLLEGSIVTSILMLVIRVFTMPTPRSGLWLCICTGWTWIHLQWLINKRVMDAGFIFDFWNSVLGGVALLVISYLRDYSFVLLDTREA